MKPYFDLRKRLELFFLITLVGVAIIYGCFRAYPLIAGPSITIYAPQDGDYVNEPLFEVSGQVRRVSEITLQGRPITIDTEGHFLLLLVAQFPYTILVLVAKDQYGKTESKVIHVTPN